jgi:exodeoxyribonuclease V gamma subunit
VYFEAAEAPLADEEPFVLDALQRYTSATACSKPRWQPDNVDQALEAGPRLQNSGLLPMAGFGECLQRELIEPLPDLLQRYQQLLALWPTPLTSACRSISSCRVCVSKAGSRVHQRDGGVLSVTAIPNSIGSIKSRKWHRLIKPWVNHLVACASGSC